MPDLSSLNSHDLNPVNYIWGIIQKPVCQTGCEWFKPASDW